jgi:hypothetical protein
VRAVQAIAPLSQVMPGAPAGSVSAVVTRSVPRAAVRVTRPRRSYWNARLEPSSKFAVYENGLPNAPVLDSGKSTNPSG